MDTKQLPRDELARAFGNNQRLIRAFEAIFADVADVIPAGMSETDAAIGELQVSSSQSAAASRRAEAAVDTVAASLERLAAAVLTQRTGRSHIADLQRRVAQLETLLLGT